MSFLSRTFLWPLRLRSVRRRVWFELQRSYFAEADLYVPLGYGCQAPILLQDYWHSFQEIFMEGEYQQAGTAFSLPVRWLDLGCHAGFFSLFLEWQRRKSQSEGRSEALLVDGDRRLRKQVERLIAANGLEARFRFVHGAVGAGSTPLRFVTRACMASGTTVVPGAKDGEKVEVPIVTPGHILNALPPPYDLIKVDIEGGEYDFLTNYEIVLSQTNTLLLEWHAWHSGGGGVAQLIDLAAALGFSHRKAHITPHQKDGQCGVLLLQRS